MSHDFYLKARKQLLICWMADARDAQDWREYHVLRRAIELIDMEIEEVNRGQTSD